MMAETELEEGEACSSHGDVGGDGADFDPFVALSYIDDKINRCLGHLQKDFEGGITADKLGAKFGGYGSFLPSYQRSPSNWALPEQSHNNANVGSNVNSQRQVLHKGPLLPLDVTRKANRRSGSEGAHSAPSTRYPSAHVPTKDTCLDSSRVLGKGPEVMLEPPNKSVGMRGSRKLELRMKEDLERKNAELYIGLGLDYSSSASSDTSTEGTSSLPHESEVTSHESPTSIIQIMTAFPFPERMLSPLHDKLIHLAEEGNFDRGSDNQLLVIDTSVGKSADITPGAKVSKMKVREHANKKQSRMNSRRESGIHSDNDLEVLSKRMEETGSKPAPTVKACKTREVTDIETKTCRKVSKDAIEHQVFYSGSAKDEESESDQNHNSDDSLYARHGLKFFPVEKHPACKRTEETGLKLAPTGKACKVQDATDKATKTFRKVSKTAIENLLFSSDSAKGEESESDQNLNSNDNSYARHDTKRALVEKHPSCKRTEETGSKPTPTVKACKPQDATDKATKKCRKAPKDAIEEQLFSSDSAKDEDYEADQAHNSNDYLYASGGSKRGLVGKRPACSNMDNSADHQHDSVHRSGRILDQRISQCKGDFAPGLAGNEAMPNKMIDTRKPSEAEKQSSGSRKKASGKHSHEMPGSLSEKESAGVLRPSGRKKIDCDFSGRSGTSKSKDINMARENYRSSADSNLKPLNSQRDAVVEQRSGGKLKASNREDNGKNQSRGKANIQEVDHQAASERLLPEASHSGAMIENGQDLPTDDWVCCDSCEKWRLLPLGRMTKDLPEHWVCSMMDWLPRMNCDVPEDEATAAVQLQNAASLNNMHDNAVRTAQGFNSASFLHLDHNLHNKNATSVSDHRKKKHGSREILHAANASTPRQILNPKKKYRKDSAINGSMNEMARSSLPSDFMMTSTTGMLNETNNTDNHVDKRILITEGDSKQIMAKRKLEVDSCRMPKKLKSEFEYHTNEHRKSELDMDNEEMDRSLKKPCQPQSVPDTRSLETKPGSRRKVLIKRKKSDEGQDSENLPSSYQGAGKHAHNNHLSVKEPCEAEVPKAKKAKMPKSAVESGAIGSNKSHRKEKVNQNVVSSSDAHLTTVKEKTRGIEAEKLRLPKCEVAARDSLGGPHSLESDPCLRPVSVEVAPKASKISRSHKNKVNIDELRGSQVELPSSNPSRTTKANNLGLLSGENLKKENDADCRMPVTGSSRQCLEAEGASGNTQHEAVRKEKTTHSRSLDSHVLDFRDRSIPHKSSGKFKVCFKSSKLRNGQLNRDGSVPERKEQHDELHRSESYNGMSMPKNDSMHGGDLDTEKSVHVCSLQSKDVKFGCHSEKEEIKPSDSVAENGELHSRKKSRYVGNTRCKHDTPDRNVVKSVGKDRIHLGGTDAAEQRVCVERAEGQPKGAQQQHTKQSVMEELHDQAHSNKTSTMLVESQVGKSQCLPNHAGRQDSVAWDSNPAPGSSKEAELDASKVLNLAGDGADQDGLSKRLGSSTSNQPLVRDTNDTAVITKESFGQSKTPLIEAEDLRAYADRLKNSGFLSESAEVYFQAALKFLDSAFFLEAGNSGSNSHGKMTPMQMYSNTAKLCESCVHEYERLGETAAAALVYKCMEVAYMKMVYCKHFSANRFRNELQATIQMVPQGESPSSSASDLDNLNTQGSIEKATLCKGSAPHILGSQIPAAQNRNFSRLLDFTQDVTSAMEASMKSQDAFAVASPLLEEANKKEAVAAVKRALDFSFQDVGELVKLVNLAKEFISR